MFSDNVYRDDVGKTSLHAAASGVKVDGTIIETVDFLLKNGAMKILNKPSTEDERVKILASGQHCINFFQLMLSKP